MTDGGEMSKEPDMRRLPRVGIFCEEMEMGCCIFRSMGGMKQREFAGDVGDGSC